MTLIGFKIRSIKSSMKNSWLAKIMYPEEGTGLHHTGLDLNHLNSFHVSETLGKCMLLYFV